jgi:pectin methylesterase-like acyl-CoA thioesterase
MKHVDAVAVELVVVGDKVMMMVVVLLAAAEAMWTTTTECNVCVVKHLLHVLHWPLPSN